MTDFSPEMKGDFEHALEGLVRRDDMALLEDEIAGDVVNRIVETLAANQVVLTWQVVEYEMREPTSDDRNRMIVEDSMMEAALRMSIVFERQRRIGEPFSNEELTDIKKQYIATLFIQGDIEPDDEWIKFLNAILPGENLNLLDDSDGEYVGKALETHMGKRRFMNLDSDYSLKYAQLLERHGLMIGEDLLIDHELFYDIAKHLPHAVENIHEAEAALDELCRNKGLSPQFADEMKRLIRNYAIDIELLKNEQL